MRANAVLFWSIAAFFFVVGGLYAIWNWIAKGEIEWAGSVALTLCCILAVFLAFYLGRTISTQGGALPEDRPEALIDDGDPEQGFFSPWSWWPILLAAAAGLVMIGLAVTFWIAFVGIIFGVVCLVGWVYEYYRGYFAR